MSYSETTNVYFADSPAADAFGRHRVSNTEGRLDVEFLYDKQPEYFDEITNNGTVTQNAVSRDLTLSLSDANNGSYAEMASYPVPYTPGSSQMIESTGVLDLTNLGTGTAEVFLRSNVTGSIVEESIEQADWVDSTSGVDWADSHIFGIDFQSLKVGRIRFYLNRLGIQTKVAELTNDNKRNTGYWENPNLPAFFKIHTTGGITYAEIGYGNEENAVGFRYKVTANATATMKAICTTVKTEGGADLRLLHGLHRHADMGATINTVSTTLEPLISIRHAATFQGHDNLVLSVPKHVSVQASESIRLVFLEGGTLSGPTWTAVNASNSVMEYDVAQGQTISGGREIDSAYIWADTTGGKAAGSTNEQIEMGKTVLWYRQGSETGIFTVAAQRTSATDAECLASIAWEEIR